MLLKSCRGVIGRVVTPQLLDQAVARDGRARVDQEEREDAALLHAAQAKLLVPRPDLERAEDAEVETCRQMPTVPRVSALRQGSVSEVRGRPPTLLCAHTNGRRDEMRPTRIAAAAALVAALVALAGCGGDGDDGAAGLRAGVYEFELSESYLVEHGISAAQARAESGVHEMTIDSGRFIDRWRTDDGTYGSCWGTYAVEGIRVVFRFAGGCVGDWAMSYAIDGDNVTWSEIEALDPAAGPDEQKITEVFNGVPWTRTGDAPE